MSDFIDKNKYFFDNLLQEFDIPYIVIICYVGISVFLSLS